MSARSATLATPFGPFTVVAGPGDRVLAAGWTEDTDELLALVAPVLRPARVRPGPLHTVAEAAERYFAGDIAAIDTVAVTQRSGPFLERAWDELRAVRPGAPITYAQLAARLDSPRGARAASQACGRNAVALFVPCHRIVRTDGALGGFRWGPGVKRRLLAHEAAPRTP